MGVSFTKIWRIKNVGTCSWTTSYALVYLNGEKFGAQNSVPMPGSVGPGQSIDIPVQLTAPNQSGHFKGYWRLRNASGVLFGVGNSGEESIYVDVNVSGYNVVGYDFLDKYCEAEWQNGSQTLPCPGADGDNKGFVIVLNSPKLENGNTQSKGLVTHPQMVNNGLITGKYPAFTVQSGDRFQASINCLYKANDCNMVFKLQYQIGNGTVQTLGQWNEIYEGESYSVNVDLSALNGQKVKFILSVLANGSAHEDYALWIAPRVARVSAQPPTTTFTPRLPLLPPGLAQQLLRLLPHPHQRPLPQQQKHPLRQPRLKIRLTIARKALHTVTDVAYCNNKRCSIMRLDTCHESCKLIRKFNPFPDGGNNYVFKKINAADLNRFTHCCPALNSL